LLGLEEFEKEQRDNNQTSSTMTASSDPNVVKNTSSTHPSNSLVIGTSGDEMNLSDIAPMTR
jgi:hypothetical protein